MKKKEIFCALCIIVTLPALFGGYAVAKYEDEQVVQRKLAIDPERLLKEQALKLYVPNSYPKGYGGGQPLSIADGNTSTGEAWLAALTRASQSSTPGFANYHFHSNNIKNSGTSPWTGVTITATWQIIEVTTYGLEISVFESPQGTTSPETTRLKVYTPGTYTVTTRSFVMNPNVDYLGVSGISVIGQANKANSCYAKLLSIKVNLGDIFL